jgi:Tol biopolymer transport system component
MWSPSGDAIAYTAGTERDLWIAGADGSNGKLLARGKAYDPQWLEDGESILFRRQVDESTYRMFQAAANPPAVSALEMVPEGSVEWFTVIGGTHRLFCGVARGDDLSSFYIVDLAPNAQATRVDLQPMPGTVAIGPNGDWVAYVARNPDAGRADLWLTPIDGQPTSKLEDVTKLARNGWTPDGQIVLTRAASTEIWSVAARGEADPVRILTAEEAVQWLERNSGTKPMGGRSPDQTAEPRNG